MLKVQQYTWNITYYLTSLIAFKKKITYNSTFFQYYFNYLKFEFIAKTHNLKLRKSQNIEGKELKFQT